MRAGAYSSSKAGFSLARVQLDLLYAAAGSAPPQRVASPPPSHSAMAATVKPCEQRLYLAWMPIMQDSPHQRTYGRRIVDLSKVSWTTSIRYLLRRASSQCFVVLYRVSNIIANLGMTITVCTAAQRPRNEIADTVFGQKERMTRLYPLRSRSDRRGVLHDLFIIGHLLIL